MKKRKKIYTLCLISLMMALSINLKLLNAQKIKLETEVKITDYGLYYDGDKVDNKTPNSGKKYDYYFGDKISAHGDCVKTYGDFVFLTWYKGGKGRRNVMLSRYNKKTKTVKTIEFPHKHTGYLNQWWIGESHNTIAVGVSELNGSIHLLYDMHAYSKDKPKNNAFANDYFRYSFAKKNAATVPDKDFNIGLFVKNNKNGYKHLGLNGKEDYNNFSGLTYPKFFTNKEGDLFLYIREGGNDNGAYKFAKYDAVTSKWSSFTYFNVLDAKRKGDTHNWGLYGTMKYVNGKVSIGFQRRLSNKNDKYLYQNGFYYAYSNDKNGKKEWRDFKGKGFGLPLIKADKIKISEPGNLVSTTAKNKVNIIKGFDWIVTDKGDVHFIGKVKDLEHNKTVNVHTYKKAGATKFRTTTNFAGAEAIYTSGNDIYIVGLKGGKVYIEKTKGGTSNFTRVYEAATKPKDKKFRYGHVYISDGKVYYYLMERKTGSAQPLYLQVIDLGINKIKPKVKITVPTHNSTIEFGKTVDIKVNAKMAYDLDRINFRVNNEFIGQDQTLPYSLKWKPAKQGVYYLDVIAYDVEGNSVTSDKIKVKVFTNDDDISGIYRFKNVATGKYMDSNGKPVAVGKDSYNDDRLWRVVRVRDDYYNIDCEYEGRGCLVGLSDGIVLNSKIQSISRESNMLWKAIPLGRKVYRFENKVERLDYLSANPSSLQVGWSSSLGNNTKWELEKVVSIKGFENSNLKSLNIENIRKSEESESVNVFPNPAHDEFTIKLQGFKKAKVFIYDLRGAMVYKTQTLQSSIKLRKNKFLKSGLYILKASDENGKTSYCKLMIK